MMTQNKNLLRHIFNSSSVILATSLLCLILCLTLWGSLKLIPDTEHLENEILRQKTALTNRNNRISNDGSKENIYLRNEKSLKEFFVRTNDFGELPKFIEELFNYANELGLTIDRINYQPQKLMEHRLVKYGLTFQLEGNYDQIKHMVFLLENSPRIIALNKLQFQLRSAESRKVVLGLDLETYFVRKLP